MGGKCVIFVKFAELADIKEERITWRRFYNDNVLGYRETRIKVVGNGPSLVGFALGLRDTGVLADASGEAPCPTSRFTTRFENFYEHPKRATFCLSSC